MAPVKVFGMAMSGNVARVLVCLEEVGVEYELVNMDFGAGEHKNPEHPCAQCKCSSSAVSKCLGLKTDGIFLVPTRLFFNI
jgi:hypothetical protein